MNWTFIEEIERYVDIAGKLRIRILCENNGEKECFFLKFQDINVSEGDISKVISQFLKVKNIPEVAPVFKISDDDLASALKAMSKEDMTNYLASRPDVAAWYASVTS